MSKHLQNQRKADKPEAPRDCGCGAGKSCVNNQKHNVSPPEFDAAYPKASPRRFSLAEIRWMKDHPGEAPFLPNPTQADPHWSDR